ncbi:hypothetical protein D9M72_633850 [compost metagenome]
MAGRGRIIVPALLRGNASTGAPASTLIEAERRMARLPRGSVGAMNTGEGYGSSGLSKKALRTLAR